MKWPFIFILLLFSLPSEARLYTLAEPIEVEVTSGNEHIHRTHMRLFSSLEELYPIPQKKMIPPTHSQGQPIFLERVPHHDRVRQLNYMRPEEWDYLLHRDYTYFEKVAVKIHGFGENGEALYAHVHRNLVSDSKVFISATHILWHLLDFENKTLRPITPRDWVILQEFYQKFYFKNKPEEKTIEDILLSSNEELKMRIIHHAVRKERPDIVELLVREGVPVDASNKYGETTLHIAIKKDASTTMVKTLLSLGADFTLTDKRGRFPLTSAIHQESREAAEILALVADVNRTDQSGRNALHMAADYGLTELIYRLLERNADPDAFRAHGDSRIETALMIAIRREHIQVARELIPVSNVNAIEFLRSGISKTALCLAVEKGHLEIMNLLLESRADPNILCHISRFSRKKETPLVVAIRLEKLSAAKMLIPEGDVNLVEKQGHKTALYWAAEKGYAEIVDLLLEQDADPSIAYRSGFFRKKDITPAQIARKNGHVSIAEKLERY